MVLDLGSRVPQPDEDVMQLQRVISVLKDLAASGDPTIASHARFALRAIELVLAVV